jgi:SNF2 family DNA or RNA helicase
MARLFGKEYHEHSNSWHFKSIITRFSENDIEYKKYLDEDGNYIFKMEAVPQIKNSFPAILEILLDKNDLHVINHSCSECGKEICSHFLSIVNFGYHFLSSDILSEPTIQTYQTKILNYNEYWQRIVLNAKIEISEIYNPQSDKIRIILKSYLPLEIRIISLITADKPIPENDKYLIPIAEKQMKALSEEEIQLLKELQRWKCSFSKKGIFFSVYRKDFVHLLLPMRHLERKIYIKETGDQIEFSNQSDNINYAVNKISDKEIVLRLSPAENISAFFIGKSTFIFRKNVVSRINHPFQTGIAEEIFHNGYMLQDHDIVYLFGVVAKQLALVKSYIDFDKSIPMPDIYNHDPKVSFLLRKKEDSIIMNGYLIYDDDVQIPLSVIRFPSELIRYDQEKIETWFYIPPQIRYRVFEFVEMLPHHLISHDSCYSELVFTGEKTIDELKKIIFERADESWDFLLDDELKNEFIYRVKLQAVIKANNTKNINWFEFNVSYQYKDISFTHDELKKFFTTKEKFLKLSDGRLLFFDDKSAFLEMEDILQKSQKEVSESYRLSIYNIPYLYQISQKNPFVKITGDNYFSEMFNHVLNRKLDKSFPLPTFLQPIMRSYQKSGYEWLKMLEYHHLSGILADDMGLGKTIQAISVLSQVPANTVSLVICPKTLLFNWAAEIDKFNKNLHYVLYEGTQNERYELLQNPNIHVIIASYSIIQNDIEELRKMNFHYLILDEAQHIKNVAALRTKAVKKLVARHKLALSGTPVENHPQELWSIFDFLMPGYLPVYQKTISSSSNSSLTDEQEQKQLRNMTAPFLLRRKKKDVLIELPDKQEQIVYCKMTELQEKLYLQILEKVRADILDKLDKDNSYLHVLAALTKLRQICNHPNLIESDIKSSYQFSGKTELLREIIEEALENDKKILIFSQFVKMLHIIRDMLLEMKIPFEYMDGSTKNRRSVVENFNHNNNIKIFLISLKTGGFGLNLTAADTVILVDPWWNPMGENQAIDRAHRIGQTKKVNVYKMITLGSVEEKIVQLQESKKMMFSHLIESGQQFAKSLTLDQLKDMFK